MTEQELLAALRTATEDDVSKAIGGGNVSLPLDDEHKALEFFHCMLDVLTDARKEVDAANRFRIQPGFGSTE
jgi:hypothetical protein